MRHDIDIPLKSSQITFPSSVLFEIVEPGEVKSNFNVKETEMETQEAKPKHQPKNLFDSKEKYLAFRQQWSKLANEKKLTSTMMVFYNIVRGIPAELGFTSITNKVKLENGARADAAYQIAIMSVKYICVPKNEYAEKERVAFIALFEGTVNDEFITKIANYL